MAIGQEGLALIMRFEGLHLEAYLCPAGVWTIGYGHISGVKPGDRITAVKANEYLMKDLIAPENAVRHYVSVPLSQNQFDALVSFTYNLGTGNFQTSTLLKKLNSGDYQGAADEFSRWIIAASKKMPGLVARREAERALFLK